MRLLRSGSSMRPTSVMSSLSISCPDSRERRNRRRSYGRPVGALDSVADEDTKLHSEPVPATDLAARVAAAVRSTSEPSASLVAVGRVLAARLSTLGVETLEPPVWVEADVPAILSDPDDDAWATAVVRRAFDLDARLDGHGVEISAAAATLRDAAATDAPLAQWLAASVGPVDLDELDIEVVLGALAATVAPATLAPLSAEKHVVRCSNSSLLIGSGRCSVRSCRCWHIGRPIPAGRPHQPLPGGHDRHPESRPGPGCVTRGCDGAVLKRSVWSRTAP